MYFQDVRWTWIRQTFFLTEDHCALKSAIIANAKFSWCRIRKCRNTFNYFIKKKTNKFQRNINKKSSNWCQKPKNRQQYFSPLHAAFKLCDKFYQIQRVQRVQGVHNTMHGIT